MCSSTKETILLPQIFWGLFHKITTYRLFSQCSEQPVLLSEYNFLSVALTYTKPYVKALQMG